MKTLSTVTNAIVRNQGKGSIQVDEQPQRALNADAVKNVNEIFRALQAAFPAWRSAFPDDASLKAAKASWVKGLVEAGITDLHQIARGVRKARQSESDFFPSAGKFITWCQLSPEELGMPRADIAWMEACQHSHHVIEHEWSHLGVYEAGRRTGWFEVRNGTADRNAFERHYQAVVNEIAKGSEFKKPVPDSTRLEHHRNGREVRTEKSIKAGRAALASLKASMGVGHG